MNTALASQLELIEQLQRRNARRAVSGAITEPERRQLREAYQRRDELLRALDAQRPEAS